MSLVSDSLNFGQRFLIKTVKQKNSLFILFISNKSVKSLLDRYNDRSVKSKLNRITI